MMFYCSKYKHIELGAVREADVAFVVRALELAENIDTKYTELFRAVEHIVVGQEESESGAGAAAFVDTNAIVVLLSSTTTLSFLVGSLIHEATHLDHYQENREEYTNQLLAEERAYTNELEFLEKVGAMYFYDYIATQKESFLKWLKQVQSTDLATSKELQGQRVDMSYHAKLHKEYFKHYADTN